VWARVGGRRRCVQTSNAYLLQEPEAAPSGLGGTAPRPARARSRSESGFRPETTTKKNLNRPKAAATAAAVPPPPLCAELQWALARLGHALADRLEQAENTAAGDKA
jgi:hypothetical protein